MQDRTEVFGQLSASGTGEPALAGFGNEADVKVGIDAQYGIEHTVQRGRRHARAASVLPVNAPIHPPFILKPENNIR
jgi:hypothetical protein